MTRPSIAVVGYGRSTVKTILDQLYELRLHECFDLKALTIDDLPEVQVDKKTLVLVTSSIVYVMAKPYISDEISVIVSKRMINYAHVRELLELPDDMKVLLVSNMKEAAEETKEILLEAGIHLDYIPYYPGAKHDPSIKVAVTPGDVENVPQSVEKVIDFGVRFLDISTIIEVFRHFQISDFPYTRLSARYINSLLSVTSQLNHEIVTSKSLRNSLEEIVNHVNDAVLLYTEERVIYFINQKAIHLLGIDQKAIIGKKIDEVAKLSFIKAIDSIENKHDVFKDIDQVSYYMQKKSIKVDQRFFATLITFRKANEIQKLEHRFRDLSKRKNFVAKYSFDDMVSASPSIMEVKKIAEKIAKSNATILILGETGTGKEVLAQSIHRVSPRNFSPFVGVNFSSLSENLLESELFGYEGGAFTGASKKGKTGHFEQAHKGTIFLDEIGDASPGIQQRLLRVLQEKEIIRVGGEQVIPLDVRVIAATNRNLEEMMKEGSFRQDLFYRLNVLPIYLPPLRERKEDIRLLTDRFLKEQCEELQRSEPRFTELAKQAMLEYPWPGNVRELHNVIEYLTHIVEDRVDTGNLPFISGRTYVNQSHESGSDFDRILEELKEKEFMNDVMNILDVLNQKGVSAGRSALLKALYEKGVVLTDQKLRYRQQKLREYGLVNIQRGRKGTVITKRGRDLLHYVQNSH